MKKTLMKLHSTRPSVVIILITLITFLLGATAIAKVPTPKKAKKVKLSCKTLKRFVSKDGKVLTSVAVKCLPKVNYHYLMLCRHVDSKGPVDKVLKKAFNFLANRLKTTEDRLLYKKIWVDVVKKYFCVVWAVKVKKPTTN